MFELHVLGSGSGLPSARRDTTALWFAIDGSGLLVDCPGAVIHRLARLGVDPEELGPILITHDHVDHLYGLPHLIHAAAIARRSEPLEIHAPPDTLATARKVVGAFGLEGEGYPALRLRALPEESGACALELAGCTVRTGPTAHGRDTRAVRVDSTEVAVGHSSDTRYHEPLAELFEGVDLLLHDCSGLERDRERFESNHSSALEAGRIAAAAGAAELRLIHLSPEAEADEAALVQEAREAFDGRVGVARDGDLYRLPRHGFPAHGRPEVG